MVAVSLKKKCQNSNQRGRSSQQAGEVPQDDGGDDAPGRLDIDLRDDVAADDFAHAALELVAHIDGLNGHGRNNGGLALVGKPRSKARTGLDAVALAAVNVFGGFLVTRRMLEMFKKKNK